MCNAILEEIESLMDANAEIIAKKINLLQAIQFWREFLDDESEITFNLPYGRGIIEQWIAADSELETYKIKLTKTIDTISDF